MSSLLTAEREPAPPMRFYATFYYPGGGDFTPMREPREDGQPGAEPDYLPANTYQAAAAVAKARYHAQHLERVGQVQTFPTEDGGTVTVASNPPLPDRVQIVGSTDPLDHGDGSGMVSGGVRMFLYSEIPYA